MKRRYLFSFSLIFLSTQLIAQSINSAYGDDSDKVLSKYSYLLLLKNSDNELTLGTGCFFRLNGDTVFVTAMHNLGNFDAFGKIDSSILIPDTCYIRVPFDNSRKFALIPIDIKKAKKKVTAAALFVKPDVIAIRLSIPSKYPINTIDQLFDSPANQSSFSPSIFYYGYKAYDSEGDNLRQTPIKTVGVVARSSFSDTVYLTEENVYDSINSYFRVSSGKVLRGNSGSPVFLNMDGKYSFVGLVIASYHKTTMIVVPPNYIFDSIEKE